MADKTASKSTSSCIIKFNPFCPTGKIASLKDAKLQSKIADELEEDPAEINFDQFPSLNTDMVKRNMEICMKCSCTVFCLKNHFKHAHKADLEQYNEYKIWSNAKISQFALNSIRTYEEISKMVRLKDLEGLVDLFVDSGITVINDLEDLEKEQVKFKIGDKITAKSVPTADGDWRQPTAKEPLRPKKQLPNDDDKYTKKFAAFLKIATEEDNDPKDLRKSWKTKDAIVGTIVGALDTFSDGDGLPLKNLKPPSTMCRKTLVVDIFSDCVKESMVTAIYEKPKLKKLMRKIPLAEKLDNFESSHKFAEMIGKFSKDIEERRVFAFYCMLLKAIFTTEDAKLMRSCITRICRFLSGTIAISDDPLVKEFYKNKKRHIQNLDEGIPKKIYAWDLRLLCEALTLNMLFSIESKKTNVTLQVNDLNEANNKERVICFVIDLESDEIKLVRSIYFT